MYFRFIGDAYLHMMNNMEVYRSILLRRHVQANAAAASYWFLRVRTRNEFVLVRLRSSLSYLKLGYSTRTELN